MAVLKISKENFENEVLKADKLVLIDFFATWCGPCKMLSPIIEELAEEVKDVLICSVNTEEEPIIAKNYDIMMIPTLVFMKNGDVLEKSTGYKDKSEILTMIERYK